VDLEDVLLEYIEVVQKPFARWADIRSSLGGARQTIARSRENTACLLEAR